MTIEEIIDEAMDAVDTLKHPNLDDFLEKINPILEVFGQGKLLPYDTIEKIYYLRDELRISYSYSYSVRSCVNRDEKVIPTILLVDKDPLHLAKIRKLKKDIKDTGCAIEGHRKAILALNKTLAKHIDELETITEKK